MTAPSQAQIRYSNRVPEDAVGISYIHNAPLSANSVIQINDLSSLIRENREQDDFDYLAYVDEYRRIWQIGSLPELKEPMSTNSIDVRRATSKIASQDFMIANIWINEDPLYFVHKLRYLVYEPGPYVGNYTDKLMVVNQHKQPLRDIYKWKARLVPTNTPNYYQVALYTSFQANTNSSFYVIYTASSPGQTPIPGHMESLDPRLAFEKSTSLAETCSSPDDLFYQSGYGLTSSEAFLSHGPLRDTRPRIPFTWRVCAQLPDGTTVNGRERQDTVLPSLSIMPHETEYRNGRKRLSQMTAAQLMSQDSTQAFVRYWVESLTANVKCYTKSDGSAAIFAATDTTSQPLANVPERYVAITRTEIINGIESEYQIFAPLICLRLLDRRPIKVLPPVYDTASRSWNIRIQNGWFQKSISPEPGVIIDAIYKINQFDTQDFDENYGKPIRKIRDEVATVVGRHHIKLAHSPLHIDVDEANIVRNLAVTINGVPVNTISWNTIDSILELEHPVKGHDKILVTYNYHETAYTYRGFYAGEMPNTAQRLRHFDLNPSGPFMYSVQELSEGSQTFSTLRPTTELIDKTIYLYLLPSIVVTDVEPYTAPLDHSAYNIRHAFEPIVAYDHLLLATIRISSNSIVENSKLVDIRSRGGGLRDDITSKIIQQFGPDAESFWDIGYWDGEAYPENAVLIIRIPKTTLKEYGGRFTMENVNEIVDKYAACGVLCLVEYTE